MKKDRAKFETSREAYEEKEKKGLERGVSLKRTATD